MTHFVSGSKRCAYSLRPKPNTACGVGGIGGQRARVWAWRLRRGKQRCRRNNVVCKRRTVGPRPVQRFAKGGRWTRDVGAVCREAGCCCRWAIGYCPTGEFCYKGSVNKQTRFRRERTFRICADEVEGAPDVLPIPAKQCGRDAAIAGKRITNGSGKALGSQK
jgi:hypothetical protein